MSLLRGTKPRLAPLKHLQKTLHTSGATFGGVRAQGWWQYEHRADPHPGSDKELRERAAAKYGLLPGDYKPFGSDPAVTDAATGNYPDLGDFTYDHRDPHENWSHPLYRRNFNEPVPWNWDRFRADRITYTGLEQEVENPWTLIPKALGLWILLLGGGALLFGLPYFTSINPYPMPVMPKQYPYDFKRAWPFDDPRMYPIKNHSFELEGAESSHH